MVYRKVSLDITPAQLKRAASGQQITLSAAQLRGSGATFHVHPANHEKIMKATRAGRGTRIYIAPGAIQHDLQAMQGGSIWGSIWNGVKSGFKALKDSGIASQLVDMAVAPISAYTGQPAAVSTGRQLLKNLTGVGVRGGKLVKGSQAARDHMAAVRARRSGGSFML